ncbi:MAG: molybdopterin cofactor-binding domain-containing protein, partial [Myxococcota bacterium]
MTKSPPEFVPPIIGSKLAHDSAKKHVTGRALYVDDMPEPAKLLHVQIGLSSTAHASLDELDVSAVRSAPGVVEVLTAEDIPGKNDVSPFSGDEPALVSDTIRYHGQALFVVAAETRRAAQLALANAKIRSAPKEAWVTIEQAAEADSHIEEERRLTLNDIDEGLANAPRTLRSRMRVGGQDHLYLEGHIAMAVPGEDETLTVYSSTQHPSEVQQVVARVLGKPVHAITVEVRRMGGAFGGKETQPAHFAALAALVAHRTGRPAKLRLDRDDDMIMTGKRHDFDVQWQVGFDDTGRLHGLQMDLASRCGHSADLSSSVNDRAMFHADNAYYLGSALIRSQRLRTHTVSNTAFRGFGGPQSMVATERMMDEVAMALGRDPLDVRLENLYRPGFATTPYGQEIDDFRLDDLMRQLAETSRYRERRRAIEEWNRANGKAVR